MVCEEVGCGSLTSLERLLFKLLIRVSSWGTLAWRSAAIGFDSTYWRSCSISSSFNSSNSLRWATSFGRSKLPALNYLKCSLSSTYSLDLAGLRRKLRDFLNDYMSLLALPKVAFSSCSLASYVLTRVTSCFIST